MFSKQSGSLTKKVEPPVFLTDVNWTDMSQTGLEMSNCFMFRNKTKAEQEDNKREGRRKRQGRGRKKRKRINHWPGWSPPAHI